MVVESLLDPGRLIAMHEHRNDEIVSWVPAGVMRHADRDGRALVVDESHLMVTNAGTSFWHSERTDAGDPPSRMLQILIRPRALDLEPGLQFGELAAVAPNAWRHVFGPEGAKAPFHVRNAVDCHDIRLGRGVRAEFPRHAGRDLYFYVFSGRITAGGKSFSEGEQGLLTGGERLLAEAVETSIIIAFLIDPEAVMVRAGTVGDHGRIPPALLAPVLRALLWLRDMARSRHAPR